MRPIISKSVFRILNNLISRQKAVPNHTIEVELCKAEIVPDESLEKKTVSLNSIVEFITSSFRKPMRLQIVLPEEADLKQKKVSILSPIAFALLGFKENDTYHWKMPSGIKHLKIIKVYNHPSTQIRSKRTI